MLSIWCVNMLKLAVVFSFVFFTKLLLEEENESSHLISAA